MIKQYQEPNTENNPPYPNFDVSLVPTLLDFHCPVWYLELDGTIRAANLLAFWLWGDLQPSGGILRPTNLLGQNIFTIYSRPSNFNRIELPTTSTSDANDFFTKTLAFVRNLLTNPNYEQSIPFYREFLSAVDRKIRDNKPLSDIYETTGEQGLEPPWVYTLRIASSSDTRTRPFHFKFIGNINRVFNERSSFGYIVFYDPVGWTSHYLRDVYSDIRKRFEKNYVQYQNEEVEQFLTTGTISIKEGSSSIHIRIFDREEGPVAAQDLTTLVSAFTGLFTKFWLIQQHRFPDLVEYALTHDIRFTKEANVTITDITHNSPFDFKFDVSLNPEAFANAARTLSDMRNLEAERKEEARLKNEALNEEIEHKKQELQALLADREVDRKVKLAEADLKSQEAYIKLQTDLTALEERRLKLRRDAAEFDLELINRMLDTAQRLAAVFYPNADTDQKAIAARILLNDLLMVNSMKPLEFTLSLPKGRE